MLADAGYEIGRGASAEVVAMLVSAPVLWTLTALAEMAIKDPAKLRENLAYWKKSFAALRRKLDGFGAASLGEEFLRRAALAEFAADFPDRIPDVERTVVISHYGDVPEGGWTKAASTVVHVPDLGGTGFAIYVLDEHKDRLPRWALRDRHWLRRKPGCTGPQRERAGAA